jgi:hypothetical protein
METEFSDTTTSEMSSSALLNLLPLAREKKLPELFPIPVLAPLILCFLTGAEAGRQPWTCQSFRHYSG